MQREQHEGRVMAKYESFIENLAYRLHEKYPLGVNDLIAVGRMSVLCILGRWSKEGERYVKGVIRASMEKLHDTLVEKAANKESVMPSDLIDIAQYARKNPYTGTDTIDIYRVSSSAKDVAKDIGLTSDYYTLLDLYGCGLDARRINGLIARNVLIGDKVTASAVGYMRMMAKIETYGKTESRKKRFEANLKQRLVGARKEFADKMNDNKFRKKVLRNLAYGRRIAHRRYSVDDDYKSKVSDICKNAYRALSDKLKQDPQFRRKMTKTWSDAVTKGHEEFIERYNSDPKFRKKYYRRIHSAKAIKARSEAWKTTYETDPAVRRKIKRCLAKAAETNERKMKTDKEYKAKRIQNLLDSNDAAIANRIKHYDDRRNALMSDIIVPKFKGIENVYVNGVITLLKQKGYAELYELYGNGKGDLFQKINHDVNALFRRHTGLSMTINTYRRRLCAKRRQDLLNSLVIPEFKHPDNATATEVLVPLLADKKYKPIKTQYKSARGSVDNMVDGDIDYLRSLTPKQLSRFAAQDLQCSPAK